MKGIPIHTKVRIKDLGVVGSVQRKPSKVDGKIMVRCVGDIGQVLLVWRKASELEVV